MKIKPMSLWILMVFTTIMSVAQNKLTSVCNPLNLNYRYQLEKPSRREAADPTVIYFRDRYYLFASKSGGYWHSKDLLDWMFVETNQIPTEDYAPTVIAIKDTVYFLASSSKKCSIYKSHDLLSGKWQLAKDSLDFPVTDPAFFLDNDERLYFYWGCSPRNPIYGIELDYRDNFKMIGKPVDLIKLNTNEHGWEVSGDYNDRPKVYTWMEGAWLNKHNGKYYLQYSVPGTQFKSYCDGVYVAENPLGPYKLQEHNPFSYKPEGFIGGAGHGSTFTDEFGNYWHMSTMSISVKHNFERRLGLWPAFFDKDGTLYTYTAYGDFPHGIPEGKMESFEDYEPKWMLLSYKKPVEVSSSLNDHPKEYAVNEDIRTYWSASTGDKGEWFMIDLSDKCDVYALQVNFAEHQSNLLGLSDNIYYQYKIESSADKRNWQTIVDKTQNKKDCPNDYIELDKKVKTRYLRIINYRVPGGNFAISGFRVFGKGNGEKPAPVNAIKLTRKEDRRSVVLSWDQSENAIGYTICYGIAKNKLYQSYQVYGDTSLTINSLNSELQYYFTVESFNENGIKEGTVIISTEN
jgi:hypothetical protein